MTQTLLTTYMMAAANRKSVDARIEDEKEVALAADSPAAISATDKPSEIDSALLNAIKSM